MSGGNACKCLERLEPIIVPAGSNRPGRLWRVVQYKCNHSAFNGYHYTSSDYSSLTCLRCGTTWRTKAPYVDDLRQFDREKEMSTSSGYSGHAAAMAEWGRTTFSGSTLHREEKPTT
jgi:hypothetical protein